MRRGNKSSKPKKWPKRSRKAREWSIEDTILIQEVIDSVLIEYFCSHSPTASPES
jgi:hypothetical protein